MGADEAGPLGSAEATLKYHSSLTLALIRASGDRARRAVLLGRLPPKW